MLKTPTFGRGVFIRLKTNARKGSMVNHDNLTNRMALRRRWFIQISALSTFDGRIVVSYSGRKFGCNVILTLTGLPWFQRVEITPVAR
jgi:hypothetical protein